MVMRLVAIDPGKTGAMAFKAPDHLSVDNLPVRPAGKKTIINTDEFYRQLTEFKPDFIIVEQVHSLPRDSGSGAFSFGRTFGAIEALVALTGARVEYASPTVWKRRTMTPRSPRLAVTHARNHYPELADRLKFKKDHDRAHALMLLRYAERDILQIQEALLRPPLEEAS